MSAATIDADARRLRLRRAIRGRGRRAFVSGARAAIVLPAWVVGFSLLGIGALAHDIGMPFWVAVLSTPLIWAGPAQFVLFGSLAGGAGLISVALAVSLTSLRLLPMSISLLALMRRGGRGLPMRIMLAHFVVVTTWVEGMRVLPRLARRDRVPWFLGFANTCLFVTTGLTALGYVVSASMPSFIAAGFLFLTPLFFAITLVDGASGRADGAALGLGAGLALLLGPIVGGDFDLLAAGAGGGLAAYLLHRARR